MEHRQHKNENKDEEKLRKVKLWEQIVSAGLMSSESDSFHKKIALKIASHDFKYLEDNYESITDYTQKHLLFLIAVYFSVDTKILKFMIDKLMISLNFRNGFGNNCLMLACGKHTDLKIIKFLFEQIENLRMINCIRDMNYNHDNILTCACWTNPSLDVIKYLIDVIGMDIGSMDCQLNDCLMIACWKNTNLDVIKYFVEEKKFDPNNNNIRGETCLIKAMLGNKNFDVIKYLIEKCNVDVNVNDRYKNGIFQHAQKREIPELVYLIQQTDVKIRVGTMHNITYGIYLGILPHITRQDRLQCLLRKGLKVFKLPKMFELINFFSTCDAIKYNQFCNIVNHLEFEVPIPIQVEEIKSNENDLPENQIINDYTTQPELLFVNDSTKYFGNKQIVYQEIKYLKEIKDMADFSEDIILTGSYPKHIMNMYLHSIHTDKFNIYQIKPHDIVSFIKLIDVYPTNKLSVEILELKIINYYEMHKDELKFDEFIMEICSRYGLRSMYLHVHNLKLQKEQENSINKSENGYGEPILPIQPNDCD